MEEIDLSKIDLPERSFESVPDLIGFLKDIRDHSVDFVVPGPKLDIRPAGSSWELWFEAGGEMRVFRPTNWAQTQTVGKTPVPKKYHDTMLERGKADLAAQNLNEWLHGKDKVMVRTVGERFRAMVSDGYLPIDNLDLFGQVARTVKFTNDARLAEAKRPLAFHRADVTETDMFVSIRDPDVEYDIGKPGVPDIYTTMTVVQNSEVGRSAMSISPGFFRGACMNIYTREPALRKIHRGEKLDESIFSEDTRHAAKELWTKEVRDVLNATVVNHTLFDQWAEEFREAKEVKIKDVQVTVHKVAEEFDFTDEEAQSIIDALAVDQTILPEDRGSAYALVQSMTSAAKEFGAERQWEIARKAGDVPRIMALVTA